jgi:hypothetical protein
MIFFLFGCRAVSGEIRLSAEFDVAVWVSLEELACHRLNIATVGTFRRLGLLKP